MHKVYRGRGSIARSKIYSLCWRVKVPPKYTLLSQICASYHFEISSQCILQTEWSLRILSCKEGSYYPKSRSLIKIFNVSFVFRKLLRLFVSTSRSSSGFVFRFLIKGIQSSRSFAPSATTKEQTLKTKPEMKEDKGTS